MTPRPLGLFDAVGVEVEYMLVDAGSLDVMPVCDRVLSAAAGEPASEVERGEIAWSNELALHVIELKTNGPARRLEALAERFAASLRDVEGLAASFGARLMPTAMHPFMDPLSETRLWPHECGSIYQAFDRIFGCSGHGWSNLQSVHVNLPFSGDTEFSRLHSAIRVALPLLPALAASSPVVEGRLTGRADSRLDYYRANCRRLPVVTGSVVPELCASEDEYQARVLEPIARAIAPLDPKGVLEPIWVNARGAIARFDRGSIEIRVLDTQESPSADVSLVAVVVGLTRGLVEERWSSLARQAAWQESELAEILTRTAALGSAARLDDADYLGLFGREALAGGDARSVWASLFDELARGALLPAGDWDYSLELWARRGTLAERIAGRLGPEPSAAALRGVYAELCECLRSDTLFDGTA